MKKTDTKPGYVRQTSQGIEKMQTVILLKLRRLKSITINMSDVGFLTFSSTTTTETDKYGNEKKVNKKRIMVVVWDPKTEQGEVRSVEINDAETILTIDTSIENQKIFLGYVFDWK